MNSAEDHSVATPSKALAIVLVAGLALAAITSISIGYLIDTARSAHGRALASQEALTELNKVHTLEAEASAGESVSSQDVHHAAMALGNAVEAALGQRPDVQSLKDRIGIFCDVAVMQTAAAPSLTGDPHELMPMNPEKMATFTGDLDTLFDAVDGELAAQAQRDAARSEAASSRAKLISIGVVALAIIALIAIGWNLHVRRRRQALVAERVRADARFRAVFDHAPDLVLLLDETGVGYASPSVARVTGLRPEEIDLDRLRAMMKEDGRRSLDELLRSEAGSFDERSMALELLDLAGRVRHLDAIVSDRRLDRDVRAIVLNARDITERKVLEQELAHQATHDALTGLANRRMFERRIRSVLSPRVTMGGGTAALLLIDLDGFKAVNDTLGHDIGDSLLIEVARRLSSATRPGELVARMGGDEFAVIIDGVRDDVEASVAAHRLVELFWEPFAVGEHLLSVGASGGLALADPTADRAELTRRADAALYEAKRNALGTVVMFHADAEWAPSAASIERELSAAIGTAEIHVAYQPVIRVADGAVVALEALARWTSPTRGEISPATFIPIATRSQLIGRLGTWIRERACTNLADWKRRGIAPAGLRLNVNLSLPELFDPNIQAELESVVARHGLHPSDLVLEVTENLPLDRLAKLGAKLATLRGQGFGIALDDFGVAPTSIEQLKFLPIDSVKIDGSLLDGVGERPRPNALLRALVAFGQRMGLEIVAEGVETAEQLMVLHDAGCTGAQGFLLARPMTSDAVSTVLVNGVRESLRRPMATSEVARGFAAEPGTRARAMVPPGGPTPAPAPIETMGGRDFGMAGREVGTAGPAQ